jgi:UDP-N-acetylmuramyl pentapeptide phosphotransferase/UDP-N-acetylglucosamine-1-phosphate transferase
MILALVSAAAGAAVALPLAVWSQGAVRPSALNHRGTLLPATLGVALAGGTVAWTAFVLALPDRPGRGPTLASLAGLVMVFLAGLYDDLQPVRTRGLVRQLRALARRTVTPGVVKLAVIVGAAVVAAIPDGRLGRAVLGVPLMAGAANLWNLLDVAPGRALKFFLPPAAVVALSANRGQMGLITAAMGAAAVGLGFDLRERAMLGDAGSNALGFVIGVGLYRTLSSWGLAVALGAILVLHALAETMTLSRLIRLAPPLHWFDRLGRLPTDREASGAEKSSA